jgi:hypothetical protein
MNHPSSVIQIILAYLLVAPGVGTITFFAVLGPFGALAGRGGVTAGAGVRLRAWGASRLGRRPCRCGALQAGPVAACPHTSLCGDWPFGFRRVGASPWTGLGLTRGKDRDPARRVRRGAGLGASDRMASPRGEDPRQRVWPNLNFTTARTNHATPPQFDAQCHNRQFRPKPGRTTVGRTGKAPVTPGVIVELIRLFSGRRLPRRSTGSPNWNIVARSP